MKKILALILAVVMVLSLAACGSGKPKVDYDTEFDALIERIDALGKSADYVSTVNVLIWQEAGPDRVASILDDMRTAKEFGDLRADGTIRAVFGTPNNDTAWTYVEKFQEESQKLATEMETLKSDVKALKDACEKDHEDGIDALQKYFSKLQSYVDFAVSPSGNLMNYHSNHESYENDMAELKSTAEFEK